MGSLLNLIQNENMKIYRRMRSWILVIIMVGIVILTGTLMKTHQAPIPPNWKSSLTISDQSLKNAVTSPNMPARVKSTLELTLKKNEYAIAHNIAPSATTAWGFATTIEQRAIGVLISVFVAIVAGDIVAGEFSTGTIKLLLTRPQSRGRILLSKYIATLLFSLFLIAVTMVASLVVGGILFGFGGVDQPYLYQAASGAIQQVNMVAYLFINYGYNSISMIMIATIAFMISTIFRSSAVAIAISILSLFIGNTLVFVLSSYSWDRYILFANTDLSQYQFGTPVLSGMTLGFSITMLVLYFVVMNALSWYLFRKRDVSLT